MKIEELDQGPIRLLTRITMLDTKGNPVDDASVRAVFADGWLFIERITNGTPETYAVPAHRIVSAAL